VAERERGPTRDPPQPMLTDLGLNIGDDVSLMHVADDTGDVPYRPNVYVNDVPRDDSGAPERQNA
jgi:hypothetical protein